MRDQLIHVKRIDMVIAVIVPVQKRVRAVIVGANDLIVRQQLPGEPVIPGEISLPAFGHDLENVVVPRMQALEKNVLSILGGAARLRDRRGEVAGIVQKQIEVI